MYEIIIKFNETGVCKIDVDRACKEWGKNWLISQWHNEYTLLNDEGTKVKISPVQAWKIIEKMRLKIHLSTVFNYGFTWKS